jgi:hypothetical protein
MLAESTSDNPSPEDILFWTIVALIGTKMNNSPTNSTSMLAVFINSVSARR